VSDPLPTIAERLAELRAADERRRAWLARHVEVTGCAGCRWCAPAPLGGAVEQFLRALDAEGRAEP
jgi:hypothetical protein